VSFEIESHLDRGRVRARIALPNGLSAEARLRLRLPAPYAIRSVLVNGQPWTAVDPDAEAIVLPTRVDAPIELEVRCA
jgi:hypothetical protein